MSHDDALNAAFGLGLFVGLAAGLSFALIWHGLFVLLDRLVTRGGRR